MSEQWMTLDTLVADYNRYAALVNKNYTAIEDTADQKDIAESDYEEGVAYLKREHAAFPALLKYATKLKHDHDALLALVRRAAPLLAFGVDESVPEVFALVRELRAWVEPTDGASDE